MPYSVKTTIHLAATCADLDEIAETHARIKEIEKVLRENWGHGFTITVEKPKLAGVRAKGETEPQATTLDIPDGAVTGYGTTDTPLPYDPHAGMEIPAHLVRKK